MVKLPIVLQAETGFKEIMTAAIAMRGQLEADAQSEREQNRRIHSSDLVISGGTS